MQNLTVSSFKQRKTADLSKGPHSNANPFMPDLSMSTNFAMDRQINMIKPILRRNCLHLRNNIVVTWKSFEIQVIRLEYAGAEGSDNNALQPRYLNPVYVPMSELSILLNSSPSQIEQRILKSLKQSSNGKQFIYVPLEPPGSPEHGSDSLSRKHTAGSPTKVSVDKFTNDVSFSPSKASSRLRVDDAGDESTALGEDDWSQPVEKLPEEIHTSLYI